MPMDLWWISLNNTEVLKTTLYEPLIQGPLRGQSRLAVALRHISGYFQQRTKVWIHPLDPARSRHGLSDRFTTLTTEPSVYRKFYHGCNSFVV
jgi:hypothetical protein